MQQESGSLFVWEDHVVYTDDHDHQVFSLSMGETPTELSVYEDPIQKTTLACVVGQDHTYLLDEHVMIHNSLLKDHNPYEWFDSHPDDFTPYELVVNGSGNDHKVIGLLVLVLIFYLYVCYGYRNID
jgi:hypothetical protein